MSHFLDSTVKISNLDLLRENLNSNHSNYSPEVNLTVQEMTYDNCHSDTDGGAIFVTFRSCVYCNFSSFTNCTSGAKGGAMFIIADLVNFTQGCVTHCSAAQGTAFFIPLVSTNLSFEGCSIDHNLDSGTSKQSVYAYGHDILSVNNNFSSSTLTDLPGPFFYTEHSLNNTRLTLYNLTSTTNTDGYIFAFSGISLSKESNLSIIYNCQSNGFILYSAIESFTFNEFYFINNTMQNKVLDVHEVSTFSNSHFSQGESDVYENLGYLSFNNCTFQSSVKTEMSMITSLGCWGHSHYIFRKPKKAVLIVVIVLIASLLVGSFIFIRIHKWKLDMKFAAENESIIDDGQQQDALI